MNFEQKVLEIIRQNPGITHGEIHKALGCADKTASKMLVRLRKKNLIESRVFLSDTRLVRNFPSREVENETVPRTSN